MDNRSQKILKDLFPFEKKIALAAASRFAKPEEKKSLPLSIKEDGVTSHTTQISEHLIVSAEPTDPAELVELLSNTIGNENPVEQIVTFEHPPSNKNFDFHDFFSTSKNEFMVGNYRIKMCGENFNEHQMITHACLSIKKMDAEEDPLPKQIDLTFINLPEINDLDLQVNKNFLLIQTLLEIYEKSKTTPILINSHLGDTFAGSLVLTFEILNHYNDIFSENHFKIDDVNLIAEKIILLSNHIRENKPELLSDKSQLIVAIINAKILNHYILATKFLTALSKEELTVRKKTVAASAPVTLLISNKKRGFFNHDKLSEIKPLDEKKVGHHRCVIL